MITLERLFASGAAADIVLLAMAAEFVVLTAMGRDPRAVLTALLPGALIVLGVRGALVGADWRWIALPLTLSLPVHLLDLRARGWIGRRGRLREARKKRIISAMNAPESGTKWRGV